MIVVVENLIVCCNEALNEHWQTLLLLAGQCIPESASKQVSIFEKGLRALHNEHGDRDAAVIRLAPSCPELTVALKALEKRLFRYSLLSLIR